MPTIEAPLALFQVQMEGHDGHAVELLEPPLGIAPEALDAVDVTLVVSELVVAVADSEVLRVADIDEAVVTSPAVAMDDGVSRHPAAGNSLQSGLLAVRHDLGVDASLALEESEDDSLTPRASAAPAAHAARSEVGLIHFDLAVLKGRLALVSTNNKVVN